MEMRLSVREIQYDDIELIANYWLQADRDFLLGMGADQALLPTRDQRIKMLEQQLGDGYLDKKSYCIIWLLNGKPVGHSNVNKIVFGDSAYMQLHLWEQDIRKSGLGFQFVRLTLPYFFKNLELKTVYCEPYALNPAPNKTLEKIGFKFVKEHIIIPGALNFEQPANFWEMSLERFETL